jgi:hypothetical protein
MKCFKREIRFSLNKKREDLDTSRYNKILQLLLKYNINVIVIGKRGIVSLNFNSFDYIKNNWNSLKNLLITIIISFFYWFINYSFNNCLSILIQKSLVAQSILLFLSIITLLNLYTSVGLKRDITEKQIKKIVRSEIKEIELENKRRNSYK